MPKLASYKRIITNDYAKEDKKLVEQLAGPINDGFNELYFATNGRLSVRENIYCTYKEFDVEVDAAGNPTGRTVITLTYNTPVLGCEVIRAENQDNSSIYPTGAPFVSYSQDNNTIIINNITSLAAGSRWRVRIIAWH